MGRTPSRGLQAPVVEGVWRVNLGVSYSRGLNSDSVGVKFCALGLYFESKGRSRGFFAGVARSRSCSCELAC